MGKNKCGKKTRAGKNRTKKNALLTENFVAADKDRLEARVAYMSRECHPDRPQAGCRQCEELYGFWKQWEDLCIGMCPKGGGGSHFPMQKPCEAPKRNGTCTIAAINQGKLPPGLKRWPCGNVSISPMHV